MSLFKRTKTKYPTPGEKALRRAEARQPEVDRIVYTLTRRVEENHFGLAIEKLMGQHL